MTFKPSSEQRAIIEAELAPQCVIACPGSGKTATAVRRLLEVRRRMGNGRGFVLLLSYSNVAVETFQKEYDRLAREVPALSWRVCIETVDSFLTSYILRSHGARAMGTTRQPFLVSGAEAFLENYNVSDGKYPRKIKYLTVHVRDGGKYEYFIREPNRPVTKIVNDVAEREIHRLGAIGGYTHELGRYWAFRTLDNEPKLLKAMARRFPHIIVDEAQDIGSMHGALITMLTQAGSTVSLIGDPNQAIFEFAGADGNFLRNYEKQAGVKRHTLSQNRRSIGSIVDLANLIAGTASLPVRTPDERRHGAYYLRYDAKNLGTSLARFEEVLNASGYGAHEAIVLCRGRPYVATLTGAVGDVGMGATEYFAKAAVLRDRSGDIAAAFEHAVTGTTRLLDKPPHGLRHEVLTNADSSDAKSIRQLVWHFLRDSANGLPVATLEAKTQWHPKLKTEVEVLLSRIESATNFIRLSTWAHCLTKRDLPDSALLNVNPTSAPASGIRVDTVHKAKGEGICVVMYLAQTEDVNRLVQGTETEEGRIGYVAVTRARDLLILGVPNTAKPSVITAVEAIGFKPLKLLEE